jgi:hypothetical protein
MKKDWDILTPGRQSRWKSEREMGPLVKNRKKDEPKSLTSETISNWWQDGQKKKKKEDGRRQRGVTNLPHWQVPQVDERDRHNRDASGVNDESDNANRGGVDQQGGTSN